MVSTKTFLQWSLVILILLFLLGLTGCADLRRMTMTTEELKFFGQVKMAKCLDPAVVCIKP